MLSIQFLWFVAFSFCLGWIQLFQCFIPMYIVLFLFLFSILFSKSISEFTSKYFILCFKEEFPGRVEHDRRRTISYPDTIVNTWYHFCDLDELQKKKVIEVRALNQTFVVWITKSGKPVCQEAFCPHLGANLAVGGKVVNDCIECPFHLWKFGEDGSIIEIPYNEHPMECPKSPKLKTFPCEVYCGLVYVYFHADGKEPEFHLPDFIPKEIERDEWKPHLKWNIGFKTLTPFDWVDQAGDHAHFQTLHGNFTIPWTLIPLPSWFLSIFPVAISHSLKTFIGDDPEWVQYHKESGVGCVGKHYMFFKDYVGMSWNKKPIKLTMASTLEFFLGPAIMVFHIPLNFVGAIKVFVTTTPVEGGSVMKVRTWVDGRIAKSFWKPYYAWIISGISASQLMNDIDILCNRVRVKKPMIQATDGPYLRTNRWIKNFYSEGSSAINNLKSYCSDW